MCNVPERKKQIRTKTGRKRAVGLREADLKRRNIAR